MRHKHASGLRGIGREGLGLEGGVCFRETFVLRKSCFVILGILIFKLRFVTGRKLIHSSRGEIGLEMLFFFVQAIDSENASTRWHHVVSLLGRVWFMIM